MRIRTEEQKKRLLEYYRKYNKERYYSNREGERKRKQEFYAKNRDKILVRCQKWKTENPEKVKENQRKYYKANKKKVLAKTNAYAKVNRGKINDFVRNKAREDLHFKISRKLRGRINQAVRNKTREKRNKVSVLLGCSLGSFRIYIESKFQSGMTWDNIHLDHIVPCALFDLSKESHRKICFHFSNYQPLFPNENMSKGAKLFYESGTLSL